jgi:hypothetical protein
MPEKKLLLYDVYNSSYKIPGKENFHFILILINEILTEK